MESARPARFRRRTRLATASGFALLTALAALAPWDERAQSPAPTPASTPAPAAASAAAPTTPSAVLTRSQQLIGLGRAGEAVPLLTEALAQQEAGATERHALRFLLTECRRQLQDWPRFFDELERQEREAPPADAAEHKYWSALRCPLALQRAAACASLGMLDLCGETLRDVDRASCAASVDASLVKLQCQLDLLAYRHERVVELVDATLAPDAAFRGGAADRLDLELRKGIALSELARMGRGELAQARAALERVREQMDPKHVAVEQLNLAFALADVAWRDERLDEGDRLADEIEARLDGVAPEARGAQAGDRAQLATLRAHLALARGCDDAEAALRLADLEGAYAGLLERWRAVPHRKGGVGFLHPTNRRAILSELVRLELRVHGPDAGARRALGHVLRAQAQGSLAREIGIAACDAADVERELLGPGRGLLVYVPGADRSHVFAWDAERIVCREIEPVYAIDAAYRDIGNAIATLPHVDPKAARAAGDALLASAAPLARRLMPDEIAARVRAWKSITVAGDELFDDVCFAALRVDGIGVLGLERALEHVPSIPLGVHLARTRPAATARASGPELVFVAAPEPNAALAERYAKLARLELAPEAARRACGPFAGPRVRALTGAGATVAALRAALVPSVRVLHLMVHGVFDRGRERGQGLLLAGDPGVLWTDGIDAASDGLRPPALVLLSVCGGKRGDVRHGDDGISHMAGALLARGARCVVTSAGDLDFAAQQELARVFLARIDAGDAPEQALLAARRALAAGDFAHPYYWATLRVLGDGRTPIR
jgi:hypothetical protein